MAKKPSRDGEFIYMIYDSFGDMPEYVRGHIDAEVAATILLRETGTDFDPASAKHVWMRQQFPSHECPDGCDFELRELSEPGRGAFKVTRLMPVKTQDKAHHE